VKLPVVDVVALPFLRSAMATVSEMAFAVMVAATRSESNSHAAGMMLATAFVVKFVVPLIPMKTVLAPAPPGLENCATKI
jgi:hypothetical protein